MRLDIAAGTLNHLRLQFIHTGLLGPATLARAEPRLFRRFRLGKEDDLLASWSPRRTRWIAVNACGTDTINERPIGTRISSQHSLPILLFDHDLSLLSYCIISYSRLVFPYVF